MVKILVTGGTGFIGIPLVEKLHEKGHEIKLLVRKSTDISPFQNFDNIEYTNGDVRQIDSLYSAVDDVDVIYHLAAYTRMWAKDKSVFEDTNIDGTENVAKVALDSNIRMIYVSSFIALGATPSEPVDETYESEDGLFLDYAKTKFQAKKLIKEYVNKGLNATIFYPGIAYGPRDFNIFGQTILDITTESFMGCPGKGDNIGSFVYVYDIATALVNVADRNDLKGEEFILGGMNLLFNEWLDLIAEISGSKKKIRHFPMSLALLYGWLCEVKTRFTKKMPYINRPTIKMINYNWSYSSKKAIRELDYNITPLREGLEKTIEWYKGYNEMVKK
ncbi:MAG: NAD-dependent epimerase/dehydratase family protein [Promethearchaeota archaeon]